MGLTKRRFRIVYENDQEVDRYLEDRGAINDSSAYEGARKNQI